jgi:hypothetical protein
LNEQEKKSAGRPWTIVAFILGIVSWIVFAIPLGVAGLALGAYAYTKGDKLGAVAAAFSIVSGLLSWIIGMGFMLG